MNYEFQDYYFHQAKKDGYKARSAYKLQEIDEKFKLFDKNTKYVMDIGAAPGSWCQYIHKRVLHPASRIVGIDLKPIDLKLERAVFWEHDATDLTWVENGLAELGMSHFDVIVSDMAPNTIGFKDIDGMRSMALIAKTIPIYEKFLKKNGKFAIKIFMGPGFEEFIKDIKKIFGGKGMKTFKPKACRPQSKEIYLIKYE